MKKLMFAAAVAAMAGAALADAQVYDVTIQGTTTGPKSGLTSKKNPFDQGVRYRDTMTFKWAGLIWGCDCDTIRGQWKVVNQEIGSVGGCALWDTKNGAVVYLGNRNDDTGYDEWGWNFLNAIGKEAQKSDGMWTISGDIYDDCDDTLHRAAYAFAGAGFGTVKYGNEACDTYIDSMKGNVAGYTYPLTKAVEGDDCWFCKHDAGYCDPTYAWEICDSCIDNDLLDVDKTAVSATWTLKFNKSYSKKLAKDIDITLVYNFPKKWKNGIVAAILAKEALILNGPDCSEEEEALSEAEKALDKAQAAFDKADAALTKAQDEVDAQNENVDAAQTAVDESDPASLYVAYTNAQAITVAAQTAYRDAVVASNDAEVALANTNADHFVAARNWTNANNAVMAEVRFVKRVNDHGWRNGDAIATYANVNEAAEKFMDGVVTGVTNIRVFKGDQIIFGNANDGATIDANAKQTLKNMFQGWIDDLATATTKLAEEDAFVEAAKADVEAKTADCNAKAVALKDAQDAEALAKWASENSAAYHAQALRALADAQEALRKAENAYGEAEAAYGEAEEALWDAEDAYAEAEEALEKCYDGEEEEDDDDDED